MAFVTKFLTQVFGNKSERDIKGILPVLERVKSEFERVTGFTNDELRAETEKLKARIKEYIKAEEDEIASLKEQAESGSVPLEESEKLYDRVDKLEEVIDTKIEEVLNEVLPTAFAIVKDTARRFAENEQLEVTANDFDRDLAAAKDYVDMLSLIHI